MGVTRVNFAVGRREIGEGQLEIPAGLLAIAGSEPQATEGDLLISLRRVRWLHRCNEVAGAPGPIQLTIY